MPVVPPQSFVQLELHAVAANLQSIFINTYSTSLPHFALFKVTCHSNESIQCFPSQILLSYCRLPSCKFFSVLTYFQVRMCGIRFLRKSYPLPSKNLYQVTLPLTGWTRPIYQIESHLPPCTHSAMSQQPTLSTYLAIVFLDCVKFSSFRLELLYYFQHLSSGVFGSVSQVTQT